MTVRGNTWIRWVAAAAVAAAATVLPGGLRAQNSNAEWVTAWSTSQQALGTARITNATVRMMARVTVPGDAVRIRLDNTFGTGPVTIARAHVGHRIRGAAVAAGSNRPVLFNGKGNAVIPAGGTVLSDAVPLAVLAHQDLAVSLHVAGADVTPSQHTNAIVTSYMSADGSGDATANESADPFKMTTTAMWWLKAIDVQSTAAAGTIVAFGDSITDGTCATLDANDRWEDVVSVRMGLDHGALLRQGRNARRGVKAMVNEGIGGNTITRDGITPPPDSPPGLERLDRDVLSHRGVTDVVLFMGTNDIRREATAANVIAGMSTIISRVKARGMRIIGSTIIPRHNVAAAGTNTGWNVAKTGIRNEVNQWIRTRAPFDGVLDFDRVVRDAANPDLILPGFNCGDGIHPSPRGYLEMGASVDLALFRGRQ